MVQANYGKPLFTKAEISKRVGELGDRISKDYKGEDLIMVCVMTGAYMFFADLTRVVRIPVVVDYLGVSSFGSRAKAKGAVRISSDLNQNIEGKHVLVVEDIVNSGLTMDYVKKNLLSREPRSLKVCTLLDKVEKRRANFQPDYVGFTIPNRYVVGYGLDYQDQYRNLPYIAVLGEE
ncbi:MAG: hypoxanthine phosphoribosyltransferase [Nitrospirae bacterium]|nr:hypoxanthine phosphoribosyltransferase [Nitrospirota bacterium]MBI5695919.1 hypoxanthine phosphoribosyltransferase [Nitrospirota bacterium]